MNISSIQNQTVGNEPRWKKATSDLTQSKTPRIISWKTIDESLHTLCGIAGIMIGMSIPGHTNTKTDLFIQKGIYEDSLARDIRICKFPLTDLKLEGLSFTETAKACIKHYQKHPMEYSDEALPIARHFAKVFPQLFQSDLDQYEKTCKALEELAQAPAIEKPLSVLWYRQWNCCPEACKKLPLAVDVVIYGLTGLALGLSTYGAASFAVKQIKKKIKGND